MWSVGVTLFQMYTGKSLFLLDDEGNIDQSQLHILYNCTDEFKNQRLGKVKNKEARNLISRLLSRNPVLRPDAARILAHLFVSGKSSARIVGEAPEYDVFISYRVASDSHHAKDLYDRLTARGLKLYWDKMCLEKGLEWEEGFCNGLVNSRAFVCLMSKEAIHHPTVQRQNFELLNKDSNCDNVFLEYRLALELRDMGLIERICPVMIGEVTTDAGIYSRYAEFGPWASEVSVDAVETKLRKHLDRQGLGAPMITTASPRDVLSKLFSIQGSFVEGKLQESYDTVSGDLVNMIRGLKKKETNGKITATVTVTGNKSIPPSVYTERIKKNMR